jgi:hypothetical protein
MVWGRPRRCFEGKSVAKCLGEEWESFWEGEQEDYGGGGGGILLMGGGRNGDALEVKSLKILYMFLGAWNMVGGRGWTWKTLGMGTIGF